MGARAARGHDCARGAVAGWLRDPICWPMTTEAFPNTRADALARLAAFAPRMGAHYAAGRNSDPGPGARRDVSLLSPAVRHRLVTEPELVGTALAHHHPEAAGKFIQEVFWRSYWKGFLELRPALWDAYRDELARDRAMLATNGGLRRAHERAAGGATGIACFDEWIAELRQTGWLHNHVRMWVASIWIFTLRLPWSLGADLFLHHLLDGDAASNTLSWRWVAGIQTPGKHYVARAENIRRHTLGRFDPHGELDEAPLPLAAPPMPAARALPGSDARPAGPFVLLLHEDDLHAESLLPPYAAVAAVGAIAVPERRGPTGCAPEVAGFVRRTVEDGLRRAATRFGAPAEMLEPGEVAAWATAHGMPVVTPWAPVGWTADALGGLGVPLHRIRRDWDSACWPAATKGFFPFRTRIPALIDALRPMQPTG
jgi:deoxyribodipyrimidine photo-lyase